MELMTDYGKVDILWLDGGWVAKESKKDISNWYIKKAVDTKSGFLKSIIVNQDILMDELVKKAREKQPGLIVVDRAVPGKNQNYLTPENRVPEEALPFPWESCIIAGGGWSWVPNATYMSGRKAIHLLVDIVAKGGNLLLNVAPGPDGKWHDGAYELFEEIGNWMKVASEAIYETRAIAPYKEGNICLTKKDNAIYAIYLAEEDELVMPSSIRMSSITPSANAEITLLGDNQELSWEAVGNGFVVYIPEELQKEPPSNYAWVIKINNIK